MKKMKRYRHRNSKELLLYSVRQSLGALIIFCGAFAAFVFLIYFLPIGYGIAASFVLPFGLYIWMYYQQQLKLQHAMFEDEYDNEEVDDEDDSKI
jgi:Flp pilus assembly protein TadB